MVHQSNAEFERCHAAELTEGVEASRRYECWDRWIERHAKGQPGHRVIYARDRMAAIARGETVPALPDGVSVRPERAQEATVYRGAPLSAAASGGPAVVAPPAVSSEAPSPGRSPRYEGDLTCQPVCGAPWDRCVARCADGRMACVVACENEYRACMGGCF